MECFTAGAFRSSIFLSLDQIHLTLHVSKGFIVKGVEGCPRRTTWVALSTEWICPEQLPWSDLGKSRKAQWT